MPGPGVRGFRSNIQLAAAVASKIQSKRLSHSVVAPLLRTFPGMTHQKEVQTATQLCPRQPLNGNFRSSSVPGNFIANFKCRSSCSSQIMIRRGVGLENRVSYGREGIWKVGTLVELACACTPDTCVPHGPSLHFTPFSYSTSSLSHPFLICCHLFCSLKTG